MLCIGLCLYNVKAAMLAVWLKSLHASEIKSSTNTYTPVFVWLPNGFLSLHFMHLEHCHIDHGA